jgi:hypothetical protein
VQGDAKVHGVFNFGTDLQFCDSVEGALSRSSCQSVWNGNATKSEKPTPFSSTFSITPAYSTTSTLSPHSSLPPATTSSTPTVTPTSLTSSLSIPHLSTVPSLTTPDVPPPTTSPGVTLLIGSENDDEPEVPSLVILGRRSPRTFICSYDSRHCN